MLPHLIWEQSTTYSLAAICIHTCRAFGKSKRHICLRKLCETPPRVWWRNTLMLWARPSPDAIWISHNTWPRGRSHRPGLRGSEQILQREVKLDRRRCIRAKHRTHSCFHTCVWNGNSVRLSPAASKSLGARCQCLLDSPEERCCTVTNLRRSCCSQRSTHCHTNIPDP